MTGKDFIMADANDRLIEGEPDMYSDLYLNDRKRRGEL